MQKVIFQFIIMKEFISVLFVFALTLSIKAQDSPLRNYDILKNRKFKLDSTYKELPKLKFNENLKENLLQPNKKQDDVYLRNPSLDFNNSNLEKTIPTKYNMPVYKPLYFSEMPTLKPDSSVKYHMLVKKVDEKTLNDRLIE
ncbi:MAG: hypothetical protein HC831_10990 [Chloroflexia bacterium]|nr:hypothetical protein [Chloroflexia bacterium]